MELQHTKTNTTLPAGKATNHARNAALLSALSMGIGQLYNRQIAKGIAFLAVQIIYIYYIVTTLASNIAGLISLGDTPTKLKKVGKLYKNVPGDHSIFMMIYGLVAVIFILILIGLYIYNIRDAYRKGKLRDHGKPARTIVQSYRNLLQNSFPFVLLSLPTLGVLFFTIVPIIFMILMAFTNYSAPDHIPAKNLVDWVGFKTFHNLFYLKQWASTFYGVLTWTIIWAITATVTCYFGGIFVALLIQQKGIRFKGLWRSLFIIPYAIPQFISFLIMRNLLNYQFGPINQYFRYFGLDGLPWLNDPFWAKVTVILVNMWVGIPVSMVLVLGILTTIPKDLYEAAEVDGATDFQKFRNITFPFILFSTAPLLIMQFAGNINNFNVIYLLTKGLPANGDYAFAGSTDLLVTWLYKLTLDNQRYNFASAIGIIIFIIIASFSLWNYRRSRSFKEEDMVQ
ncbi:carbohydrate ABC transporter permease [Paenibacillus gansuensis]|uniref:Maltose/maltodextrin transport system permease protein n=1 Tax=Paenibacillus gansuensis TaxID=306542 RepID=A0ABW5PEA5_9BACL